MTSFKLTLSWSILLFTLGASARAGFLDFRLPRPDVQVVTVTDVTPAGALRRPASPANPVYYVGVNTGFRDFGGIVAGDKPPRNIEMTRWVGRVLAKQGYLPATDQHPASVVLFITWGTMYVKRDGMDPLAERAGGNRRQILRFLGGYKFGMTMSDPFGAMDTLAPELVRMDVDSSMLDDLSRDDLFVVAIGAYDLAAFKRKEKALLWTTKISTPAEGLDIAETMPTMLAIAGPSIGRDTPTPVWVLASEKYKPEIKIGEAVVVPDVDSAWTLEEPKPKPAGPERKRGKR